MQSRVVRNILMLGGGSSGDEAMDDGMICTTQLHL